MISSAKSKEVINHMKRIAPKPMKEEVVKAPKVYRIKINPGSDHSVRIASNQTFRPHFLMVVLKDVVLSEQSFKEFIDMQTDIHQDICKKRTLAALGTHDLDRITGPFSYEAVAPSQIKFVPLKQETSYTGLELAGMFEKANDATMIKYLQLIKKEPLWPVLYDETKEVLSLPPVINSKYSQISTDTKNILVECSSSISMEHCKEAMNALLDRFCKLMIENSTSDGLVVEQVKVTSENGHVRFRYPTNDDIESICGKDDE